MKNSLDYLTTFVKKIKKGRKFGINKKRLPETQKMRKPHITMRLYNDVL